MVSKNMVDIRTQGPGGALGVGILAEIDSEDRYQLQTLEIHDSPPRVGTTRMLMMLLGLLLGLLLTLLLTAVELSGQLSQLALLALDQCLGSEKQKPSHVLEEHQSAMNEWMEWASLTSSSSKRSVSRWASIF